MADGLEATTAPVPLPDGIAPADGQAPSGAPETPQGEEPRPSAPEPSQPEQPEPSRQESRLWKDLDSAERDYKQLQAQYTKLTQGLGSLGIRSMGELQERMQILEGLGANPEFLDWARAQVAKATAGSGDEETQQALQVIEQIAEQKAEEKLAPLKQQALLQKVGQTFARMDQEFGPEWQTMKGRMFELLQRGKQLGLYHPSVETEFDYEFLKGLYIQAAAADPQFVAKQYEKRLRQKQSAASQSSPGTPGTATHQAEAKSMEEAYQQAKRELGMA